MLQSFAAAGRTVIVTVHQPSAAIFSKFDKLILMAEGHNVYQGPPRACVLHFQSLGYEPPPLVGEADFYMKVLHVANRDAKTAEEEVRLDTFVANYNPENEVSKKTTVFPKLSTNGCIMKPHFWHELACLSGRAFRNMRRSKVTTRVRLVQTYIYAALLTATYCNMGDDENGVQDRAGLMLFYSIYLLQGGILCVVLAFPVERSLFVKEQSQGLYGALPYFLAKLTADFPVQVFCVLNVCAIVYFGIGLNTNDWDKPCIFSKLHIALISFLVNNFGDSLGLAIGALFPQISGSLNIGMIFTMPYIIFGGYFIRIPSIPRAFRWFSYFSVSAIQLYRYSFEALCMNEFTSLDLTCSLCSKALCEPCDPMKTFAFQDDMWTAIYVLMGFLLASKVFAFFILKLQVLRL